MGKTYNLKRLRMECDGLCPLCGERMDMEVFDIWLTAKLESKKLPCKYINLGINIDHVLPLSKGGKNNIHNMVLVHVKCNIKKGNQMGLLLFHKAFEQLSTDNPLTIQPSFDRIEVLQE